MAIQLPLDIVPNTTCSGAFALFRVSTSYTGPTINVRRSSDNATSDFYANAYGQLGTALNGTGTAIETWLGSSTGYITTWHDQSGKGNHATQTTAAYQPTIDLINNRVDLTSGSAFFNLPNGTVPMPILYSTPANTYLSTNSAARTTLISNNNQLENIYETVMYATVGSNGPYIGITNLTYLPGSRTNIVNNEFSAIFSIFQSAYTKAVRIVFRKNGSIIDCYQSQGLNWNYNLLYDNNAPTDGAVPTGSGGYGVYNLSIYYNTPYTVTVKHNTIGGAGGTMLSANGSGAVNNAGNGFRRDTAGYLNWWYANDFAGNTNTYATGNTVSYTYDGSYNYLYINGTPQGVSVLRSGWSGVSGNEYIGRSPYGEYLNGELYYLFSFKSLLETNERSHIERGVSLPNQLIKLSQIKSIFGINTSTLSLSQAAPYIGASSTQAVSLSMLDGCVLRNGLFMRFYSGTYFSNNVSFFNNNTPTSTGVTTNLRNTYCATGGKSNPNTTSNQVGNIAVIAIYSVEWFGLFYAPITGTYTFYLLSDDTSIIWIGNNALSGYTTSNALFYTLYVYTEVTATISLTGGTYYPFRFQYGAGGGDNLTFSFTPPGRARVYDGTGYFFCQSRNVSGSSSYNYVMRNGSTELTTSIQGTTSSNPATSGYAIYSANPWLPNGTYWIKSAAMPNALQMYVDIKRGGFDFYTITGGTSVNYITQTHSGTALGLELMIPRSQNHWRSIDKYIHTTLASNYTTWMTYLPIYKTASGGNYTSYAMFDPRLGNSGSTAGSYNGAPDWTCKDGGLWYLRDVPYGEPNGDYTANAFLGTYNEASRSYGAPDFNDGNDTYYTGSNYIVSTNYAGSTLSTLYTYFDGSTSERAAPSALYIKNQTGTNTNGVYWINLPTVGATQVYCIMDSTVDGGGWMMAMKATRGTTFPYDSTYWTAVNTLNATDNTRNDGDAKFNTMNYFPCKDLLALWPDIPYNYGGGTGGSLSLSGYNNWCWMKNNYNSGSKLTLINYFSTANNVSFGTPKGVERGTAFSSQAGNAFYGVNFTAFSNMRVRWGFAWNNENDWGSNDVIGGIGQYANWGALQSGLSAGDQIGCCQDQTGINRSARVEMYIR